MRCFAWCWIVLASLLSPGLADEPGSRPIDRITLPGSGFEVITGVAVVEPGAKTAPRRLLQSLRTWLVERFQLPDVGDLPEVALVPSRELRALRYRDVSGDSTLAIPGLSGGTVQPLPEIVAVYDGADRIIYLLEDWSGATPVELSVLVHELVHHMQNVGKLRFECPSAREKLAFEAQEQWLQMFGHSLEDDFGIDGLTLLVRTNCL